MAGKLKGRILPKGVNQMIKTDTVRTLTSLPATDLNFTSCLQRATDNQIRLALETMRNRDGKDKGRIKACERELKRRDRSVKKQSK